MRRSGSADAKPTPADLGIDPSAVTWERSGEGAGSIEIAMTARGDWILMRVAGDPARRILLFDRTEWECFIDGARKGEFGGATQFARPAVAPAAAPAIAPAAAPAVAPP